MPIQSHNEIKGMSSVICHVRHSSVHWGRVQFVQTVVTAAHWHCFHCLLNWCWHWPAVSWCWVILYLGRVKRIWYLSPMRAAKVQASLRIRAVSPEPPLLAHTGSESRGTFRQKASSLAPLNDWACAVKICHDGMLEDTNSLDAPHFIVLSVVGMVVLCLHLIWKSINLLHVSFSSIHKGS